MGMSYNDWMWCLGMSGVISASWMSGAIVGQSDFFAKKINLWVILWQSIVTGFCIDLVLRHSGG